MPAKVLLLLGVLGLHAACMSPVHHEWTVTPGEGPLTAPLVTGELIAVGTGTGVTLLELTGKKRCSLDMGGRSFAPKALGRERFVVTSNTTVQVLDDHCTPIWKRVLTERASSAPGVGEVIVVPTVVGKIEAYERDSGEMRWELDPLRTTPGFIGPPAAAHMGDLGPGEPVVGDQAAYVLDDAGVLFALDLQDGRPLWSVEVAAQARSTPALADGRLYATAEDGGVHAIDAQTHDVYWRQGTNDRARSTPFIDQGVLYVGSDDRHLYAIDVASTEVRWSVPIEGPLRARPGVYRNLVFAAGGYGDGRIYAFERTSGERFWERKVGDGIINDIAIVGDIVYATTVDSRLVAFKVVRTFDR